MPSSQKVWPIEIFVDCVIDAPREQVWEVLNDFDGYKEWNPLLCKARMMDADKKFEVGRRFKTRVRTAPTRTIRYTAEILLADSFHYRWRSTTIKNVFEIEHFYRVEQIDANSCRFFHGTIFSGVLPRLRTGYLESYTRKSYEDFGNILKERVAKLYGTGEAKQTSEAKQSSEAIAVQ